MFWKMSKQSYSKYTTFFKHLQELSLLWTGKTFPCSIYWDVFWCPQRLPGQWPCAYYKVLPCAILGLSLVSCKSRDKGGGQEKWPFFRTLGPPVGILPCWGFTLNFSIPASQNPPFTAQYLLKDAPVHSLFPNTETAANSSLEQIKGSSRNISETCS